MLYTVGYKSSLELMYLYLSLANLKKLISCTEAVIMYYFCILTNVTPIIFAYMLYYGQRFIIIILHINKLKNKKC